MVFEVDEIESLSKLDCKLDCDTWPVLIRVQEVEPKEQQVLYVYLSIVSHNGSSELPQLVVHDQKLEMPNPITKTGITSFRITPVFLAAPNSITSSPCLICLNEVANLVSLPCGHLALGDLCIKTYFEKNDNRLCLVCRREVKELVSITESGYDFERATEHRKILDNKEDGDPNLNSLDQSAVMSTIKQSFKKEPSVISENHPPFKSPRNTPPKQKTNHELYFPSLKNSQVMRDDRMSSKDRRDELDSFSRMPFANGAKKELSLMGELKSKTKPVFGTHTHQNSREKDSWTVDQREIRELENTGIASNRRSEPQLLPKKKQP